MLRGRLIAILAVLSCTVLVIPAGVAHCNEGSSPDFQVVGATDRGRRTGLPRLGVHLLGPGRRVSRQGKRGSRGATPAQEGGDPP